MEYKYVYFAVKDNNNLYKLELGKTLLHFTEFDFTYFWERCIDAGRAAKKTGRLPQNNVAAARNIIAGIHPYVEALIGEDFSDIVTDCIIEYICHSERIGMDELWVRCISPKNLYEEALFKRISEYRTGRAINQWSNIVKLREYASHKLSFIYDCDGENAPKEKISLRAGKEYFDLACSLVANELGIDGNNLPSVRVCNVSLAPNATFINSKVSKAIYRRFSDALSKEDDITVSAGKDCGYIKDKLAMDAYSHLREMKRPPEPDMRFASEVSASNAEEIYLPDSFKAVIDLEFDMMMKNDIVLRKCEDCGRYFIAFDDGFLCNRVNSSGLTCRGQYDSLRAAIEEAVGARDAAENAAGSESGNSEEAARTDKTEQPKAETKVTTVPPELEKRGQKIYNSLYKRVGKSMEEKEFREWSRYLSDLKRNIKTGEAGVHELEEFLDYSDRLCEAVKLAAKTKSEQKPEFKYPEADSVTKAAEAKEQAPEKVKAKEPERTVYADEDPEMAHIHVPIEVEEEPVEIIKAVSGAEVEVKPFKPESFDSAAQAFMAGIQSDASPEKNGKKAVEIKPPQWTRLTREEAYGSQEDNE